MTKTRRLVVAAFALACVGYGSLLTGAFDRQSADSPDVQGSNSVSFAAELPRPDVSSQRSPSGPRWGSDTRSAAIAHMRVAFERELDLRILFERALADPASGGIYYAARALGECVSFAAIQSRTGTMQLRSGTEETRSAATALAAREVVRCNGLGDERSKAMLEAALLSGAALDDPLEGMILRERKGRTDPTKPGFDGAFELVRQGIVLGDPNFFVQTLALLNASAGGFDDLDLRDKDAGFRDLLAVTTQEARCNLGVDCERDALAVSSCVQQGDCGPYVERIGNWAGFTADERLFVVQAAADVATAAQDGTLPGRYRR